MARKIRIVSDGTPKGTKIIDEASGELIGGVSAVRWVATGRELAKVTIDFVGALVPVDLIGEVEEP